MYLKDRISYICIYLISCTVKKKKNVQSIYRNVFNGLTENVCKFLSFKIVGQEHGRCSETIVHRKYFHASSYHGLYCLKHNNEPFKKKSRLFSSVFV